MRDVYALRTFFESNPIQKYSPSTSPSKVRNQRALSIPNFQKAQVDNKYSSKKKWQMSTSLNTEILLCAGSPTLLALVFGGN